MEFTIKHRGGSNDHCKDLYVNYFWQRWKQKCFHHDDLDGNQREFHANGLSQYLNHCTRRFQYQYHNNYHFRGIFFLYCTFCNGGTHRHYGSF